MADTLKIATTLRDHSPRVETITDEALAMLNLAETGDDEAATFVGLLTGDAYTPAQQAAILGAACALVSPDYAARLLDAWGNARTLVTGEDHVCLCGEPIPADRQTCGRC